MNMSQHSADRPCDPFCDACGRLMIAAREQSNIDKAVAHVRAAMVEMRRTAVNYFDRHGQRCDGDYCNHFATWSRSERDYPMHACDGCVEEMITDDKRVRSKGGYVAGEWGERDDAELVRELSKASAAVGDLIA